MVPHVAVSYMPRDFMTTTKSVSNEIEPAMPFDRPSRSASQQRSRRHPLAGRLRPFAALKPDREVGRLIGVCLWGVEGEGIHIVRHFLGGSSAPFLPRTMQQVGVDR